MAILGENPMAFTSDFWPKTIPPSHPDQIEGFSSRLEEAPEMGFWKEIGGKTQFGSFFGHIEKNI